MDYSEMTTGRLILRKPERGDLQALFDIHNDPQTNLFNPSSEHSKRSMTQTKEMLERWLDIWDSHGFGYWSVALLEQPDRVIGFGGLSPKDFDGEVLPNLYYRFSPDAWGKGYATEMARAALEMGRQLPFDKIVASVRPDNTASVRVLERLGMERAGKTHDQYGVSHLYARAY